MKGKRRVSGVLLIVAALIIMQLPVSEADAATSASDFKMEGTTLVKYQGTSVNVSIPNTVEVIAEEAFEENDHIERVVIPDSVKQIEAYAFWGCDKLDTVVLGKGLLEVGDYVFTNCKGLEQITIPETVRSIGIQAFADCINLTDITIPYQVTSIHETSFDGCFKLYIHCEEGSYADKYAESFYQKQKEMPEYEDVPDYGDSDVSGEDNDNVGSGTGVDTTPEENITDDREFLGSTQIVGNQAVVFINNTSLSVHDGGELGEKDDTNSVIDGTQMVESGALPKYTIVDGRVVADQAFYKDKTLKQIALPLGIEEIGQFAFARSSVTEIAIPEGVTEICYGAFYHADQLKEVSLPNTVENVEPKAFAKSLWVEEFLKNGTEDFLISGNVLVAYRGAAENVVIPEGITLIAAEAFMNHNEIKSITLPESLLIIGEGAFEGCISLTEVSPGTQLVKIKDRAFAGCPLNALILPSSLSELGLKVFDESVKERVKYEGEIPVITHEASAERLSNEKYRTVTEDSKEAGVTVIGTESCYAELEGVKRAFTLYVKPAEEASRMTDAYSRVYQGKSPEKMVVYDLQLTDNSGIPITKLGKQCLTIILPLQEEYLQENVVVYTMDRNGQLEKMACTRVKLDGEDCIRIETTHISSLGICIDNSVNPAEEGIVEFSDSIQSMSARPGEKKEDFDITNVLKWILGIATLIVGSVCLLYPEKKTKIQK